MFDNYKELFQQLITAVQNIEAQVKDINAKVDQCHAAQQAAQEK
jgi:outer membrane murein-binding lipoprotein Lpp